MEDDNTNHPRMAGRPRLWPWAVAVITLLALSIAWSLAPLRELVRPETVTGAVGALANSLFVVALADAEALGALGVAMAPDLTPAWLQPRLVWGGLFGLVALPVTLMVVLTVVAFGPLAGFACALAGATLSALAAFGLGRALGHGAVVRMTGSRIHRLSRRLGDAGVIGVAALRMVPLAHFTVLSLIAGASHVRLRSFVLGTVLGMTPGIGLIALLIDRLVAVSAEPGLRQYLLLVGASLGMLALLLAARLLARRLGRLLPRPGRADDGDQESAP